MLEVLAYLRANGFKTPPSLSGGACEFNARVDRGGVRHPPEQIVGST
jgi:hypothetical protein